MRIINLIKNLSCFLIFLIALVLPVYVSGQTPTYKITYSTYLGGDDYSSVSGIDVDPDGNVYLIGNTRSKNLVTTEDALEKDLKGFNSAFVQVIDSKGQLVYSTYLNYCSAEKIKVDSEKNVYVVGNAYSPLFQTTPNAFQNSGGTTFIRKIDTQTGALIYSTKLGSKNVEKGADYNLSIDVDKQGNIFIAGLTHSTEDFPITSNALQKTYPKYREFQSAPFISKLNAVGTELLYSTFLGDSDFTVLTDLKVDAEGNAYLAGFVRSAKFPVTPDAYQNKFAQYFENSYNGFLTKINNTGSEILYSSFVGGSDSLVNSITIDEKGSVYLTGSSIAEGFKVSQNAYQPKIKGKSDDSNSFVIKFNKSLNNLDYATFFGGTRNGVGKILIDKKGLLYLGGDVNANDIPVTKDAYQKRWGNFNFFITLFGDNIPGDAFLSVIDPSTGKLVYSTFIGGRGNDSISGMVIDDNDNIYLAGSTESSKFPVTKDALQKKVKSSAGFLTKFSKAN